MPQLEGMVYRNEKAWKTLASHIEKMHYSQIFIIVDENTERFCLPLFFHKINSDIKNDILKVKSGEQHKNIDSCIDLWRQLSAKNADRHCLIINLGGGMVTDLGGFVASTYKRGVSHVHVPTTLLAMVDASIGGKNGIDFGKAKNQIGTINQPKMVIVEPDFLNTLPERQLISGSAEMIKHGLIHSAGVWERVSAMDFSDKKSLEKLIWESIEIKNEIVSLDPHEENLRKTLNYGHTLGHAIESHCMESTHREPLLHGEAVAIGMILATYISNQILDFPEDTMGEVCKRIISVFPRQEFSKKEIDNIISLLLFDKKNRNGKVLFVLLYEIGSWKTNCSVDNELIFRAFEYYGNL